MKLFETNADIKADYRPENINYAFEKCIKYKSNGEKNTSIEQYLEKIRPYLGNTTSKYINCLSSLSKDRDEKQLMYFKSDNIEIMIGNETDKIVKWLF